MKKEYKYQIIHILIASLETLQEKFSRTKALQGKELKRVLTLHD